VSFAGKTLTIGIHSFPSWYSAFKRDMPASSLVVSLGKALNGIASTFECGYTSGNRWQPDSKTKKVTLLSPGRAILTNERASTSIMLVCWRLIRNLQCEQILKFIYFRPHCRKWYPSMKTKLHMNIRYQWIHLVFIQSMLFRK